MTPRRAAPLHRSTPDGRPQPFPSVYVFSRNSWLSAWEPDEKRWPEAHTPAAAESQAPGQRLHVPWEEWAQLRENWRAQSPTTRTDCEREDGIAPRKAETEKHRNEETLFPPPAQAAPAVKQNAGKSHLPGHFRDVLVLIYNSERCYKLVNNEDLWWDNWRTSRSSLPLGMSWQTQERCRRAQPKVWACSKTFSTLHSGATSSPEHHTQDWCLFFTATRRKASTAKCWSLMGFCSCSRPVWVWKGLKTFHSFWLLLTHPLTLLLLPHKEVLFKALCFHCVHTKRSPTGFYRSSAMNRTAAEAQHGYAGGAAAALCWTPQLVKGLTFWN